MLVKEAFEFLIQLMEEDKGDLSYWLTLITDFRWVPTKEQLEPCLSDTHLWKHNPVTLDTSNYG